MKTGLLTAVAASALLMSCAPARQPASPAPAAVAVPARAPAAPVLGGTPADLPPVTVYRMSSDYSHNVAVTVDADGNITSYPAPSDLSEAALPVAVGHGLWLDRRGVGLRSVFTRYTYAEYMALPEAPTPQQLRRAIIPGARVTAVYALPPDVAPDSATVAEYIAGHPGRFAQVNQ
ncbi:MAG: hypothetical protein J6C67_07500 [Muribaculaceae bacterium]|nr:hypothetical protein [Muribaculaceae bacterium]